MHSRFDNDARMPLVSLLGQEKLFGVCLFELFALEVTVRWAYT
jgi:hypothetical protein